MADRYQFNEISHVDFGGNARNQDVSTLAKQFHKSCSIAPEEQQLSPSSKKEAATSKPSTSRNETSKEKCHEERSSKKEASASSLKRKQGVNDDGSWKMKEDSNAQVKAMDGFMFYLQLEWENVKKDNPGIPYKDIGRLLARRWYKMSAEDQKALHEAAEADKI